MMKIEYKGIRMNCMISGNRDSESSSNVRINLFNMKDENKIRLDMEDSKKVRNEIVERYEACIVEAYNNMNVLKLS